MTLETHAAADADPQPAGRFRYEALADFIAGLVKAGTLPAGSRAPSLREISTQHRTSLSTAVQAYRLLEDRGVLEARPQSGYYVARAAAALPLPAPTRPPLRPAKVAVSGLMLQLLENASNEAYVPLGCAIPSPRILASPKLDRILARTARTKGAQLNNYSPPRGEPALRSEIARRAMRFGQALPPDGIAITCGCTEALALALDAVTEPGDAVAIESPTYFGLLQVLRMRGLRAVELPTDAATGVVVDALRDVLAAGRVRACVLASSFQNPMGFTMPRANRLAVLRLLAKHRVPLIEDDVYGDIHFGEERPVPFSALDRHDNTIYCGSFSKTLAPGYRIGWIVPGRHMARVLESKFASTLATPVLTQVALAEFLSSGEYDRHLRRLRREFADTLERMSRVIEQAFPPGTKISRPAGNFVLWVELPRPVDTRALFGQALKKGVCFAPGVVFSASGRYAHCMRLSGGHGWDAGVEKGLRALGALATRALR
ncbi:DNA-binding transcriptional MocR family regulator [Variovorax sp. TBS-050B]|uniref:aminotransferase-like domain-containing protein n=1 Tax=Variovorax sp. TBS-050B TaxID=2940551 RepID=UPI0024748736|nr:PLP-dependent aminotransferase family protein [Variovorax sp. TBS-050B]MDH6590167.1 DNA-binding transcriptional MocR family regulator [Variovorax sp. TBS-050B]